MSHVPLQGVRVQITGSVPDDFRPEQAAAITQFVKSVAIAVFREGGAIVHGSHPTLMAPLSEAAKLFAAAGGARDALTLVRAQRYTRTNEELAVMEEQREYCIVEVIPSIAGRPDETLVPMRDWMADRSDVIIAVGGKHWHINKARAGVPLELEAALRRGKPGFVVAGFGGAVAGYVNQDPTVLGRLRNGLSVAENRQLAESADVDYLVDRIVSQIQCLPIIREGRFGGRLFRVLTLDGGGLRGGFTAAVLAKWDDMLKSGGGNDLVKNFDLVAGTSTGAILAIGLGLGLTPLEMLSFYRSEGPKIFPKDRGLRHWLKSKHESSTLRSLLESVFGSRRLRDSCCRLVIPTVRAVHGEAEAIVTPHSPDRTGFATMSAVDAALASSAAPTYFDEAVIDNPIAIGTYLDGGIWANNPVLPAIAEAVRYLNVPLSRIDVLSVGTLGNEADFTESLGKGKAGWAPSSADLFFAAQEHAATVLADSFLGHSRHLRVNQLTPTGIKLDNAAAIEDMALRGANVGQDSFVAVRSRFLDGFHVPDWSTDRP